MKSIWKMCIPLLAASLLSACGGGGGSAASSGNSTPNAGKGNVDFVVSAASEKTKPSGLSAIASDNTNGAGPLAAISSSVAEIDVTLRNSAGVSTNYRLALRTLSGQYVTTSMSLPVGTYQVTSYMVNDSSHNALYCTPATGSPLAYLVAAPLPVSFTVTANGSTQVAPEIISTASSSASDFGLSSFNLNLVSTLNFLITAIDATTNASTTAAIAVTSGGTSLYSGTLSAGNNSIMIKELAAGASYVVTITKTGYQTWSASYSGAALSGHVSGSGGTGPIDAVLTP